MFIERYNSIIYSKAHVTSVNICESNYFIWLLKLDVFLQDEIEKKNYTTI